MASGFDPFDPEEWADSPGCEAFEIAIDMRAKGGLAASALPVLQAHLAACDACQDYARRSSRLDASLIVTPAATTPDWQRMRDKMRKDFTNYRRSPWLMAVRLVLIYAVYYGVVALFGAPRPPLTSLIVPFALIWTMVVAIHLWRARELRRFLQQPDTVAAYRQWLQTTLRRGKVMKWSVLMFVCSGTFQALAGYRQLANGQPGGGPPLFFGVVVVVGMIVAMIWHRRVMRRTARELAELH